MNDSDEKQLKQMVRIKRFAIEQWLERSEKPTAEPINNRNGLFLANQQINIILQDKRIKSQHYKE